MADKKISLFPAATPLTGNELVIGNQDNATKVMTTAAIAALAPVQDHGNLVGLTDDDHPQYHNNTRGDARYPPITRQIITGNGLTGGGTLSADLTLAVVPKAQGGITVTAGGVAVDIVGMNLLGEAVDPVNDRLVIYNASGGNHRAVSPTDVIASVGGVPTTRQIISGNGLVGGGDLTADRTLAVGAGNGITVNADDVALDAAHARNVDHSAVSVSAGTGLTGGGTIAATRTLSLDTTNTRNTDHAAVALTGTNSITGGGDLTANRTFQLSGDAAAPGNSLRYGTNGTGVKGWYQTNFNELTGSIANAQVPSSAVTQWQASLSIAWGQITGTKNADQLQGNSASAFVGVSSNAQLNSLGVGTAASGTAGEIRATNNVTAFYSSDVRFKENVRPIENALEIVRAIRGVRFDWTDEYLKTHGGEDGFFLRKKDVGVIAQSVELHLPEIVGHRSDGSLALKYERLCAVLFEAVRELDAELQALKAKHQ